MTFFENKLLYHVNLFLIKKNMTQVNSLKTCALKRCDDTSFELCLKARPELCNKVSVLLLLLLLSFAKPR